MKYIDRLEKLLKMDLKYFLKNGFWLGSAQIITAILALVTISIMGNFLPKETFGEYRYLLSIASVLGIFYLSGYSTTITQEIARGNFNYYKNASKNVLLSSLTGTLIAICMSSYYLYNQNTVLGIGILLIGIFTPFLNTFLLTSSFFSGLKEFKKSAITSLIPDILSAAFLILASIFFNSTILLLLIYLSTNLIGNFIIHKIILNKINLANGIEVSGQSKTFDRDSIHYSIMNVIAVLGLNFDKLLIFTLIGSKELAIFFFAQAIPLQARGVLRIIHNLTFPKFIDKKINIRKINKSILGLLIFGALGVTTYILLSPFIFKFIFPQYIESIYMTQLFSLSLIVYPAIYLMSGIMLAKNNTSHLYTLSIFSSLTNIIFLSLLITNFGLIGAIYSAILSSVMYFLLSYFFLNKISSIS